MKKNNSYDRIIEMHKENCFQMLSLGNRIFLSCIAGFKLNRLTVIQQDQCLLIEILTLT